MPAQEQINIQSNWRILFNIHRRRKFYFVQIVPSGPHVHLLHPSADNQLSSVNLIFPIVSLHTERSSRDYNNIFVKIQYHKFLIFIKKIHPFFDFFDL